MAVSSSFTLTWLDTTVYTNCSATSTNNGTDKATIEVAAGARLNSGWYDIYSSGVRCDIYIDGSLVASKWRIFGDGEYYDGSSSFTYTYASTSKNRGTSAQSVSWRVIMYEYIDGTNLGQRYDTGTQYVTMAAKTSYAVTYNANGGTPTPASQTKIYGTTLTLTNTVPTRSDAVFYSWGLKSGSTWTYYSKGGSYTTNAAATFKARWRPVLYLTFDANGGTGAPSKQTYYASMTSSITPDTAFSSISISYTVPATIPTRARYKFLGWSTNKSATAADSDYTPNVAKSSTNKKGSITLYAVWKLLVSDVSMTTSNPVLGSAATLRCTRADATAGLSYYDVLTYSAGSVSGTIGGYGQQSAQSYDIQWTPPLDIANASPSSNKVTVTIKIETYESQGRQLFGSSTITSVMTIPDNASTKPGFEEGSCYVYDNKGYYETFATFVQSQSQIAAYCIASGKLGATITSIKYEVMDASDDSALQTVTTTDETVSFNMSQTVATAGTRKVRTTLTDSRGFTQATLLPLARIVNDVPQIDENATSIFAIAPYSRPQFVGVPTVEYYPDDLNPIRIKYEYAFTYAFSAEPDNVNLLGENVRYRLFDSQSGVWFDSVSKPNIGADSPTGTFTEMDVVLQGDRHYLLNIVLTDYFGNSVDTTVELVTSLYPPIIDLYKNKGIALGKAASEEGLTLGEASDPWDLNMGGLNMDAQNFLYRDANSRAVKFMPISSPSWPCRLLDSDGRLVLANLESSDPVQEGAGIIYLGNNTTGQRNGILTRGGGTRVGWVLSTISSSNSDGDAVIMGDGGMVVVGSGESAKGIYDEMVSGNAPEGSFNAGSEEAFISSDNNVYIMPNCQTVADRHCWVFNTSGHLIDSNYDLDISSATNGLSSNIDHVIGCRDKNSRWANYIDFWDKTDGSCSTLITARKYINGANVNNSVTMTVDKNGNCTTTLSNPAAWCKALGYTSTSSTSGIFTPVSSVTIRWFHCVKWGNVVNASMSWYTSQAISVPASGNITDFLIGTFAAGYRPPDEIHGTSSGDGAGAAWYYIGSSGQLQLGACEGTGSARTIDANTNFDFYAIWVV